MEEEGFASKKIDAERNAAAAACFKLRVSCLDLRLYYKVGTFVLEYVVIFDPVSFVNRKWVSLVQIISYLGGELAREPYNHNFIMTRKTLGLKASLLREGKQMNKTNICLPKKTPPISLRRFPCFHNLNLSSPGSSRWPRHPTESGSVALILCTMKATLLTHRVF